MTTVQEKAMDQNCAAVSITDPLDPETRNLLGSDDILNL